VPHPPRLRGPGRCFYAGLQDASCCPSLGPEHKRRRWQRIAAPFAELCLWPCVQSSRVAAGRAHAKGERLPPIVKARMLDPDCQSCLLDLAQPGAVEQQRKGALASTGKLRLILDLGIEFARRIPEQAERALTTSVIPHARRHDTAWVNDAHHFTQPLSGICHEVNDELRENSVERLVGKRQLLCRRESHVDAWVTVPGRRDERLGRINSRNEVRSQPPYQLGGKRTWTTADVEHSLTSRDTREIGKLRCEQHRVPAHEAVICISPSEEAH
jgi:hypothetical protein